MDFTSEPQYKEYHAVGRRSWALRINVATREYLKCTEL